MSNDEGRSVRYNNNTSNDSVYEGENLFGWDNSQLKDTGPMLEKCMEAESQRAMSMWGFNVELDSPDNSPLTGSRWMYMIDRTLEEETMSSTEVKTISGFRGRKLTSGSATSDYYSFNGDGAGVGSLQDFKPHLHSAMMTEPPLGNSEGDDDMDYGLERLELPICDDKTAS